MLTDRQRREIITSVEWFRYTGDLEGGYAKAGTTGKDAIELRCPLQLCVTDPAFLIEYRPVGDTRWYPTGYTAVMRYDKTREHELDTAGYEFIPYYPDNIKRQP